MPSRSFNTQVFLIFLVIILIINIWLFKPMFHSFAFGAIIAGAFYPVYLKTLPLFKERREWAGVATCLAILLIILLPLVYLIIQLSKESVVLYAHVRSALTTGEMQNFFFGDGPIAVLVEKGLEFFRSDLTKDDLYQLILERARSYSGLVFNIVNHWLENMMSFFLSFFVMMLIIYELFIEGPVIKEWFFRLSPLPDNEEQIVLEKFKQNEFCHPGG